MRTFRNILALIIIVPPMMFLFISYKLGTNILAFIFALIQYNWSVPFRFYFGDFKDLWYKAFIKKESYEAKEKENESKDT